MTTTCPAAPAPDARRVDVADDPLARDLDAAARCGRALEAAGLHLAFRLDPRDGLSLTIERDAGEPLRTLSGRELFALIDLEAGELRAWAARPELPIPGGAARAATL
jgi:hypothetical protein